LIGVDFNNKFIHRFQNLKLILIVTLYHGSKNLKKNWLRIQTNLKKKCLSMSKWIILFQLFLPIIKKTQKCFCSYNYFWNYWLVVFNYLDIKIRKMNQL
jgi:hypothetical protein